MKNFRARNWLRIKDLYAFMGKGPPNADLRVTGTGSSVT